MMLKLWTCTEEYPLEVGRGPIQSSEEVLHKNKGKEKNELALIPIFFLLL